jgi:putative Holliday junction resolvase
MLKGMANSTTPKIILAFDFGTRRIGVATGDTLTRTARPLKVLEVRGSTPWTEIATLISELLPALAVVGVPYNMDGTEVPLTHAARAFGHEVEQRFHLPVAYVDERQSSRDAEAQLRTAREQGWKRRRVQHADVDMIAAKVILERWYDSEAHKQKQNQQEFH